MERVKTAFFSKLREQKMMDHTLLAVGLGILGILGLASLLTLSLLILQHYQGEAERSYRRSIRNLRLKQITAITCLFCLAMTASYGIIHNVWGLIYLLLALKTATWWFRFVVMQRS
jgi:hypothetical protein